MSASIFAKYAGQLPTVFNPTDFKTNNVVADSVIADSIYSAQINNTQSITSSSVALASSNNSSNPVPVVTADQLNQLKDDLLGGASASYDTLKEIEEFLKSDDNLISALTNQLNTKANTSDLVNYYTKTDSDSLLNLKSNQSDLNTTNTNVQTNTNAINLLQSDNTSNKLRLTSLESDNTTNKSNITVLQGKTSALSFNPSTNTTTIDNIGVDTLVVGSNVIFNGSVTGLTKSHVGLSNVDNTSDLNKPISTQTQNALNLKANQTDLTTTNSNVSSLQTQMTTANTNITSLTNNKQDKSSSIYSNTYYLNAGVNKLSDVLTAIGNLTSTCINVSASGHSDTSNPVSISKVNLTICGPDSAFSSPSTTFNFPILINGSTSTRNLLSNIQFAQAVSIDGTQGRHSFKGCTFNSNFSLLNSTTNWINFYYCSFSGQINIPSTFAGYCIFYFCDFNGATLNFNNVSNQQIYINSCVNLPSLSLNALLNGFNTTATSSAINTVSLNCSGSVALPSGSVSQSSVNGLTSSLSTINTNITNLQSDNTTNKSNISSLQTDNTTNKSNISSLQTDNATNKTNITNLQTNKSDITYVDNKVNTAIQGLINNSPSALDTLNELATALGNDPNFATTVTNNLATKANQSDLTTTNNNVSSLSTNLTNNYYDKTSTDTLLFNKVNNSTLNSYYDKTSADALLFNKQDKSDMVNYYSKTATDSLLSGKVDNSTLSGYYTKTQTDGKYALQTDLTTANQNIQTNTSSINTLSSNLSNNYYTKTDSDGKFQPITGMTSYLTTTNASSTYQPLLTYDTAPTNNSTNIVRSGGIFTALQNYATTNSLSSYLTTSSASSTYQPLLTFDTAPTNNSTNIVRSGGIFTALSSYLTTSTASSLYQTISGMSSYLSLSGNNTLTGINNHSRNTETVTQSGSGTNLSLNYNSINAIFYYSPSANYTLTLTNIPTTQNIITTITGIYPNKFCATAISINGTAITMRAVGGLSNLSTGINASATRVLQQFNVFNNAGTFEVYTAVLSEW